MPIEITIDHREIEAAMFRLEGIHHAVPWVILPAVAELVQGMKAYIGERLKSGLPQLDPAAGKYAVKAKEPRQIGGEISAAVYITQKAVPLIHFDVQPKEVTARKGSAPSQWPDFTYSLINGQRLQGRSRIKWDCLPFIARMPNGHLGVYWRTGRKAEYGDQIKQAYGPSVEYYRVALDMEYLFQEEAYRRFPPILARYVDQALEEHASDKGKWAGWAKAKAKK